MLRSVGGGTPAERAAVWLKRVRGHRAERVAIEGLYAGEHWSVVRSLARPTAGLGAKVRVWVCSAGYGLLTWDSRAAPYAATFTPGQADSVDRIGRAGDTESAAQDWWKHLGSWEGPTPGAPRSVTDLVR